MLFNGGGFWRPWSVILTVGGFALVRRWIQTPSVAKGPERDNAEGEVVLGASPPARPGLRPGRAGSGLRRARRQSRHALYGRRPSDALAARPGLKTGAPAKPTRPLRSAWKRRLSGRPPDQDGHGCSVDSTAS